MYSLKYLRRQVDDLRRRLKPVLAILHLRNLSMDFCDEFRQVAFSEGYPRSRLTLMCILFQPRIGQAGFILDTVKALNKYHPGPRRRRRLSRSPRDGLHPATLGQKGPHPPPRPMGTPHRRRLNKKSPPPQREGRGGNEIANNKIPSP